jgi:hypothetical protein
MERLQRHGSVVVELSGHWKYDHDASGGWINYVFRETVKQIEALDMTDTQDDSTSGYDGDLAHAVLIALNKVYPSVMSSPMDLKHALGNAPTDSALLTALNALLGDDFISGRPMRDHTSSGNRLAVLANIQITREGRRHLVPTEKEPTQVPFVVHGDHITAYGPVGAIGRKALGTVVYNQTASESEVIGALDKLLAALTPLKESDSSVERPHRELVKVRDEISEEVEPDTASLNKWLSRSKQLLGTAALGYEVVDTAHNLFALFGIQ